MKIGNIDSSKIQNIGVTRNDTENNGVPFRGIDQSSKAQDEDLGATANMEDGRSGLVRQMHPNIKVKKKKTKKKNNQVLYMLPKFDTSFPFQIICPILLKHFNSIYLFLVF